MAGDQRQVGRIVDQPDLELAPQLLVTLDFVGQIDPGLGAARQPVQHDDDAALWIKGLQQVQVRSLDAALAAQQCAQRLLVEA